MAAHQKKKLSSHLLRQGGASSNRSTASGTGIFATTKPPSMMRNNGSLSKVGNDNYQLNQATNSHACLNQQSYVTTKSQRESALPPQAYNNKSSRLKASAPTKAPYPTTSGMIRAYSRSSGLKITVGGSSQTDLVQRPTQSNAMAPIPGKGSITARNS